MSDGANGDRASYIPEQPRKAFPTLPSLDDDTTPEERAKAYADLAAACHHAMRQVEWELEVSNAERVKLRHEVEYLALEIKEGKEQLALLADQLKHVCEAVQNLGVLIGAGK